MNPNLLTDIQAWHDADEHQKIIDALTALPGNELDYELTCLLARAYNNRGEDGDYERAVALLISVADQGSSDPIWHYRLGYAYYFLGREYEARQEFEYALLYHPGDEDCLMLIHSCNQALALPIGIRPFSERIRKFWELFLFKEQELQVLINQDARSAAGFAALLLNTVFEEISCEVVKRTDRYELIVNPGNRGFLALPCLYWKNMAPVQAKTRWDFTVAAAEDQKNEPVSYHRDPKEEEIRYFRSDITEGSTLVPELPGEYDAGMESVTEQYHRHGITACFLCYPVGGLSLKERSSLQRALIGQIAAYAGDFAAVIGSASGRDYDYIDLLCYHLRSFLDSIAVHEEELPVEFLYFQVFRSGIGSIALKSDSRQEGTILTKQMEDMLNTLFEEGRMYDALDLIRTFIDEGIQAGSFTEQEAYHDMRLALHVAYANNNIDDYEHYISTEKWLKRVEDQAAGSGVWYYRYASALIYLGRLEEALEYSEKGIREDPDYPWGYLNTAALRCHFADTPGALKAVEAGLALVPGDYEFLRLRQEIEEGKSLEEMENHYISPEDDERLAASPGDDPDRRSKERSVAGILCRHENLARILKTLHASGWSADSPYCRFTISYLPDGEASGALAALDACFRMNQAAASKFDPEWIARFYAALPSLTQTAAGWLSEHTGQDISARTLALLSVTFEWIHKFSLDLKDTESKTSYCVYFTPDFEVNWRRQENYYPELYTGEELEAVSAHIEKHFGTIANVFREIISPDIRVDICIIEPTPERNYYTLVTCGMGAHRMKVPDTVNAAQWGRAEVLICLPPDWDITGEEETSYWPIRCLKSIARLPGENDTWLTSSHSVSYNAPFAQNTWFTGILLLDPQDASAGARYTILPNGEDVNFYQLIPLYEEEIRYKLDYGLDKLLEQMKEVSHVVDITRENVRIMDIDTPLQ